MPLNPIAYTENVVQSFLRYQLTAYSFTDPNLYAQMRDLLSLDETRQSPLFKGPYVSLSRPFRQGAAIDRLVAEKLLHPHLQQRIPNQITHLYSHQERAIRSMAGGRTTLVSTGTGSGKTECFLYPIVSQCLTLRDQGAPPGISARHRLSHERVGGRPVDAIARAAGGDWDSVRDLRWQDAGAGDGRGGSPASAGILRATYIARLKRARREGSGETVYPSEEVCSREIMRTAGRQPRILLTNVKQLELLLTRQQDIQLFSDARLDYLVFDEAHTFTGAYGRGDGLSDPAPPGLLQCRNQPYGLRRDFGDHR